MLQYAALICSARFTLSIAGKATEIKAMRRTVDIQLFNNVYFGVYCFYLHFHYTTQLLGFRLLMILKLWTAARGKRNGEKQDVC